MKSYWIRTHGSRTELECRELPDFDPMSEANPYRQGTYLFSSSLGSGSSGYTGQWLWGQFEGEGRLQQGTLEFNGYWSAELRAGFGTIRDKATFFEPHQYSEGVEYVFVNGVAVVDQSKPTWALPGRVITRTAK